MFIYIFVVLNTLIGYTLGLLFFKTIYVNLQSFDWNFHLITLIVTE